MFVEMIKEAFSLSLNIYSVANKICFEQKVIILGFRKVRDPDETGKNVREDIHKNIAGSLRSQIFSNYSAFHCYSSVIL